MRKFQRGIPLTICLILLFFGSGILEANSKQAQEFDILIKGGRVIDGTGNPWFYANIGIRNGIIVAVGPLNGTEAKQVIDASDKYVTPGFIDLHSHADDTREKEKSQGLRSPDTNRRAAPNLVSQGVTTVVINQDGRSPTSIAQQRRELEESKFGPNAVLLVGHNSIRYRAMAKNFKGDFDPKEIEKMRRLASESEIEKMRQMVREGMEAGAYGVSSGLEYIPGRWSNTDEVVAVVKEIVPYGGVYIEHERSSGSDPMWYFPSFGNEKQPTFLDNIVEVIEIAERTGATVVASHIKARGANFWGSSHAAIQLIERARARGLRVWADQYPYNTSGSDGNTRLIPQWVAGEEISTFAPGSEERNYAEAVRNVLKNSSKADKLKADVLHEYTRRGGPENIVVMDYPDSSLIGKNLAELSKELKLTLFDLAVKLQLDGNQTRRGGARLRAFSMSEMDVEAYGAQPWCATASDAGIALPEDGPVHARFYGTFPRKIRKYALERKIFPVEDAMRAATSLPAQILGFRNRGLLREGFYADVVVFDLDEIRDTATFFEPHRYAQGIEQVLVGGEFLVKDGELTWALPGVIITPEDGRRSPLMGTH